MINKKRYITGFSGLRAIGVIGVILYHLNPNQFVGGYLGVPIFLVLTGYLITDHMLAAYEKNVSYDNKIFYLRRIKRLYPQMITVLWLSSAYIFLFQKNLLAKLWQIVIANLLNVYNYWQIFNGQSYFERFAANESPFVHLWTMSIEGQFYILWPIVIYLLVKYAKKRSTMLIVFTIMTLLSALEMALLFKPGIDTSRIYYGTDTRFFSIGLGAMLATVWPSAKLRKNIPIEDTKLLDIIGGFCMIGILWMAISPSFAATRAFPYRGGIFIFSVFAAILVGVVSHPCSHWNKWLTNPVFNWIGSRSYAIYLYQFPVMIFFEDKVKDLADHVILYRLIEILLILIISEVTYRIIEEPIGNVTRTKAKIYFNKVINLKVPFVWYKMSAIAGVAILFIGSIGIGFSTTVKAENPNNSPLAKQINKNRSQQLKDNQRLIAENKKASNKSESKDKVLEQAQKMAKTKPVNTEFEKFGISQVQLQMAQKIKVTAIGDSVMAGSSQNLKQLMPRSIIDAAVSRQLVPTISLFEQYKSKDALNDNVLVGLGTNGPFNTKDLDHLMHVIGKKRKVFWVNLYVTSKDWQTPTNEILNQATKKYPNITVINWHDLAASHPNWMYEDNTHPNPSGSKYYSAYITKTIVENGLY